MSRYGGRYVYREPEYEDERYAYPASRSYSYEAPAYRTTTGRVSPYQEVYSPSPYTTAAPTTLVTPAPVTEYLPSYPSSPYYRGRELPKLFLSKLSANCLGPWLLCKEGGVQLELVEVDIAKGESHTPQFLSMNPMGKIPTFSDSDGFVVWESNAIMRFICQKYRLPDNFYPSNAHVRSRVDMALDWRQTVLYPDVAKVAYPYLGFSKDKSKIMEGKVSLEKNLKILMDYFLRETPFIGGELPSIADFSIGMLLLYLYATEFRTPARVKEYLENLASHCPNWNEVTDNLKEYMRRL